MFGWLKKLYARVVPTEDIYDDDAITKLVIQEAFRTGGSVIGKRNDDGSVTIIYDKPEDDNGISR